MRQLDGGRNPARGGSAGARQSIKQSFQLDGGGNPGEGELVKDNQSLNQLSFMLAITSTTIF